MCIMTNTIWRKLLCALCSHNLSNKIFIVKREQKDGDRIIMDMRFTNNTARMDTVTQHYLYPTLVTFFKLMYYV